jgi:hypothetical protein
MNKIAVLVTGQLRDYQVNIFNHLEHLIKPNSTDVFVYACTRNTMHSLGPNVVQSYTTTTQKTKEEIVKECKNFYGDYLKKIDVNENETNPHDLYEPKTLGHYREGMLNQLRNVKKGYEMSQNYAKENNFEYDIIVRLRPDNCIFMNSVDLANFKYEKNAIYSAMFPSGHRDPCFFSMGHPEAFIKYCSYEHLINEDPNRIDNNFLSFEAGIEKDLSGKLVKHYYIKGICQPFYDYYKKSISDFPHRNESANLIHHDGSLVSQSNVKIKK